MAIKTIICAGPSRSGSTWQYNVVRTLASAAYGSSYGAWIASYDPARTEKIHIVKMHDSRHMGSLQYDAIVTSYRDLRDVFVSERRMKWHSYETPKRIKGFLDRYIESVATWEKTAVHVMRYEQMMADQLAEIGRLAAALKFDLTEAEQKKVHESVLAMRPPQPTPTGVLADADPETQLHPGHISGEAIPLEEDTRQFIEQNYGTWLSDHGYALGARTSGLE